MQFEYDNKKTGELFEESSLSMIRKMTNDVIVKAIKKQINHLKASNTFYIYLTLGLGKPHSLDGDLKGYYGVSLTANMRLIIKPISEDLSPESLKKCTSVLMKGVDDYHGGKGNWIIP